jgi:hypothetical protein
MMIDVGWCIDILQPDAFKEAHKHIFEAIVQLFTETQPIDLLTVSAQSKKNAKLDLVEILPNSAYAKFFFGAYWISLQNHSSKNYSAQFDSSSEIIEDPMMKLPMFFDLLTELSLNYTK